MPHPEKSANGALVFGWGVFVILFSAAIAIVAGMPFAPITMLGIIGILLFAYAYPYLSFSLMVALIPFIGWFVHVPVQNLPLGQYLFGGSVDVLMAEVVAVAVFAAWGLRVIILWIRRHDVNWKPWLPLALPMAALVAAHVLSAFSPYHPDAILVVKYSLRPVLWVYMLYVVLTANLIRSNRKLRGILGVVACVGVASAIMGLVSLFFGQSGTSIPQAVPLPLFGMDPLGTNHNLLAEWLNITTFSTIALAFLTKDAHWRRMIIAAAIFQGIIALLTFTRTIWIVFAFEALFFAFMANRAALIRRLPEIAIGLLVILPIAAFMFVFAGSATVESSTSTRLMLTDIAYTVWKDSPFIGAGAGTFVERVAATALFTIEYGAPLDSHGWIQKLLAETGLVGLAAAGWLMWSFVLYCKKQLDTVFHEQTTERTVFLLLGIGALGAVLYQFFDASYWAGQMWFPIGLALASSKALSRRKREAEELESES